LCKFPAMLSTTALRVGVGVVAGRLGGRMTPVRRLHKDNVAARWVNKVLDNPLPLGAGALVVGLLQLRRIREREERKAASGVKEKDVELAEEWKVSCYKSLPLRHVSRLWGAVNEVQLPTFLQNLVLSSYARAFGCNLDEAENPSLSSYPTLGAFFRRRLKSGVRPVADACLVSPADGKVLHWGVIGSGDSVEQVKGVTYSLKTFLGERLQLDASVVPACGLKDVTTTSISMLKAESALDPTDENSNSKAVLDIAGSDPSAAGSLKTVLHQVVIYLAPGDYHGFHSPADWTVLARRHFPGELLSVNPRVARAIANLFALNERVAYLGRWKHGFFSMTAVGATNVGSVKVEIDPQLATNESSWERETFHQVLWKDGAEVKKGEYFGEFNLGSTIVLIFEAPEDFKFKLGGEGSIVKVGEAITIVEEGVSKLPEGISQKTLAVEAEEVSQRSMEEVADVPIRASTEANAVALEAVTED